MTIKTSNDFLVARQGERVRVMRHCSDLSRDEALRFAAWIVAITDDDDKFNSVLEAIQSS